MREPSVRTSRLAIAAGVAAFIAVGGGGFLLGRSNAPQSETVRPAPVAAPAPTAPAPAPLPRTWGRAEILDLAARAADATASARPLPPEMNDAVGQRLDLVLPFGCAGPSPPESTAPMRWRYDEAKGVLRVHVMPTNWQAQDWGLPPETMTAAAEGFWIARPWSTDDKCPLRNDDVSSDDISSMETKSGPISDQVVAVAQFGKGAENDLRPRGRPFQKILRVAPGDLDVTRGFRLRLIGRIGSTPEGGPVRCTRTDDIHQRPKCIVSVVLNEVRIENPTQNAPLAIWENRTALHTAQQE